MSEPTPSPVLAKRCYTEVQSHGLRERLYIGDRLCLRFAPSKVMRGVWRNDFEGSDFYPGARTLSDIRPGSTHPWLTLDSQSKVPTRWKPETGHAYLVRFVGRAASEKRPTADTQANGYGHMGGWPDLVLVDDLLSVTDLSGPPNAAINSHPR